MNLMWLSCVVCFGFQTDKASMLDEAIEYLKQLQLQVQVSNLYRPIWCESILRPLSDSN
jgi:hypothetical protein